MQASMVQVDKPFRLQVDDFRGQTLRASPSNLYRAPPPSGDAVHMDARISAGNHSMSARKASCRQLGPSCGTDMYLLDSTPRLKRPVNGISYVNPGASVPARKGIESTVEARVATANILETFREEFTIEIAKEYCRADRAGYSMASMYCGASISVLGGIRGMFIPIFGADTDKTCRAMYIDITGATCYGAVDDVPFAEQHSPVVIEFTSPCPDYASSNPNPMGELGNKGGAEFTKVPFFVKMACPKVVFIEQVGNIVNFEKEVIDVLMGLQHEGYVVHAALVSMQQYGDIENCWRLPVVAMWHFTSHWVNGRRLIGFLWASSQILYHIALRTSRHWTLMCLRSTGGSWRITLSYASLLSLGNYRKWRRLHLGMASPADRMPVIRREECHPSARRMALVVASLWDGERATSTGSRTCSHLKM